MTTPPIIAILPNGSQPHTSKDHYPSWFINVFTIIQKLSRGLIALAIGMFLWGCITGPSFILNTIDVASSPKGSRSERDAKALDHAFVGTSAAKKLVVTTRFKDDTTPVGCPQATCKANCEDDTTSLTIREAWANIAESALSYCQSRNCITKYESYYNFSGTLLDPVKCSFVSPDGKLIFGSFTVPGSVSTPTRHGLIDRLRADFIRFNPDPTTLVFDVTGFDALTYDGSEDAMKQVLQVDIVAMPLAYGLIAYMLKSWRLLLLTVINTLVTLTVAFGLLNLYTDFSGSKPLTMTASLVEVLGLAMSTDYGLFYLRRFRDEVKNGHDAQEATKLALFHAGHVVCLSSLAFAMVFVGFLFLPSPDLANVGVASVTTVLVALITCSVLTPAMLLTFPNFFSRGLKGKEDPPSSSSNTAPLLGYTVTGRRRHHRGAPYKGRYFTFIKLITKWPYNLGFLILVYALCAPIAACVFRMKHNQDTLNGISRTARSAQAYRALAKALPGGTLSPFSVMISSTSYSFKSAASGGDEFFNVVQDTVMAISHKTGLDVKTRISSVALLGGEKISFERSLALRNSNSLLCRFDRQACALYNYVWDQAVNAPKLDATLITIIIPENPYGRAGAKLIDDVLDVLDDLSEKKYDKDFQFALTGDEVFLYASMETAFAAVPALLTSTVLILSFLLAMGFKSAFVPIRLSFTVLMPLACVYGLGVLVYQDGVLDWMGISALHSEDGGFYWYIPLVTLMQSLGLVCDYDVFFASRVLEHRSDGYAMQASIVKAVWEVQNTIIAAGLIMTGVFFGLLLGSSVAVNQCGFLLVVSCFLDTFLVQPFLVPPIMSFGDAISWWPRKLPQENLITLDDAEFSGDGVAASWAFSVDVDVGGDGTLHPTMPLRPSRIVQTLDSYMATVEILPRTKPQTATIVFLHGNPTSSFLWRNVLDRICKHNNDLRLIAPDLVGHGRSGTHPVYPSFASHYRFLDAFLQTMLSPQEKAFFVLHDWGSGLGFNWISHNPHRVLGMIHMESIVAPFENWDEFPTSGAKVFRLFRETPGAGEEMILQKNFFLEKLYMSEKKDWSGEEAEIVRERFKDVNNRAPMLAWPREIPIRNTTVVGRPVNEPDMVAVVDKYNVYLKNSDQLPKLFIDATPGFFSPLIRNKTKEWKNHRVVGPVKGLHFVQETSPVEIADFTMQFVREVLAKGTAKM